MAAFYRAHTCRLLAHSPDEILGALLRSYQHNELQKRRPRPWEKEIQVLKAACVELIRLTPIATKWSLLLEYPIPRRHKRLDAVVLAADVIFCLEFKTEDKAHSLQPQRQAEDYALDLVISTRQAVTGASCRLSSCRKLHLRRTPASRFPPMLCVT